MNDQRSGVTPSACVAEQLNRDCRCVSLDRHALQQELAHFPDAEILTQMLQERPHLFADAAVFVNERQLQQMAQTIAAIESVIALPAYQQYVLGAAAETFDSVLRHRPQALGVFMGYDFHLASSEDAWPQLIEINTNAGGALLNALLLKAHQLCDCVMKKAPIASSLQSVEEAFVQMFQAEWQRERGEVETERCPPLRSIAIVDESPEQQYLYPEFVLFRALFARHDIAAVICAPHELRWHAGALWYGEQKIDLVYNRLTDFSLRAPSSAALRAAYLANGVVLTPHPYAHALYADKHNLEILTNAALLQSWGVDATSQAILSAGIPQTERVDAARGDAFWARRRQLFFKPAQGYGSKATYRGDKLTRRVFEEILRGDYVAQALVPPSSRCLTAAENAEVISELKLDLRNYVYAGQVQLLCARLWQGQTTNFRTPGGGFAPVFAIDAKHSATA